MKRCSISYVIREMQIKTRWEFPSGPVVRTLAFTAKGPGSIPGRGTEISQSVWCGQNQNKTKPKKTTRQYHYTPIRMARIQNTDSTKHWQNCRETETLTHC